MNTDELMRKAPVIPVLVVDDPETAIPLARALVAGGLPVLEVTLRTPGALQVIEAMCRVEGAIVGAGTVTRPEQFQQVKDSGAVFAVTPGATPVLLDAAISSGLPTLPGTMTPSEVIAALEAGFDRLKFFPAGQAGGIPMLKAWQGPLPEAKFCPTGGVSADNLAEYLALANVLCVGGSWVAPANLIKSGAWTQITELARRAAAVAR
jgi:2-dehydro-3-deoxyphosphogluconate aldolase/(4S)-4-hydroxy-2-oxoglutarate aldolase